MTYSLGPVIGKIGGGADIEEIPVQAEAGGGSSSAVTVHTITVQPGETVLASFVGVVTPGTSNVVGHPWLSIGAVTTQRHNGESGIAAVLTETSTFRVTRQTSSGTDHVVGTLYITHL